MISGLLSAAEEYVVQLRLKQLGKLRYAVRQDLGGLVRHGSSQCLAVQLGSLSTRVNSGFRPALAGPSVFWPTGLLSCLLC